jgi:hypothetical protein
MQFLLLACAVTFAAASLDQCQHNRGNAGEWLSVEIMEPVGASEFSVQGAKQGDNFCYGKTDEGGMRVDYYAELNCLPRTLETLVAKEQKAEEAQCGILDMDAIICTDNQIRLLAKTIIKTNPSAAEFARFLKYTLVGSWAIAVAKSEGFGYVAAKMYTDPHVCVLDMADEMDEKWYVLMAVKLAPLPSSVAPNARPSLLASLGSKSLTALPSVAADGEKKAAADPCLYARTKDKTKKWGGFHGISTDDAVLIGDAHVNENHCMHVQHTDKVYSVSRYTVRDLECDDEPALTKKQSRKPQMSFITLADQYETAAQLNCKLDYAAYTCIDYHMRDAIRVAIQHDMTSNLYELGKTVQHMLEEKGDHWSILVQNYHTSGGAFYTAASDLHYCTVFDFNANKHFISVEAIKLQF